MGAGIQGGVGEAGVAALRLAGARKTGWRRDTHVGCGTPAGTPYIETLILRARTNA